MAAAFALGLGLAWVPVAIGAPAPACCKVCKKGKACGDSCISRDKDCDKPTGCACDPQD